MDRAGSDATMEAAKEDAHALEHDRSEPMLAEKSDELGADTGLAKEATENGASRRGVSTASQGATKDVSKGSNGSSNNVLGAPPTLGQTNSAFAPRY
jgi:hypothetical protein